MHVTLRALPLVASLRSPHVFPTVREAIARASRASFRIVHFSVQGDHVHLIVEAHDKDTLSAGVRGFAVRCARSLNTLLSRRGRVWADRFHSRELPTPREVRNAIAYVLLNARKHGRAVPARDPRSSAPWFDGFRDAAPSSVALDPRPVQAPRTWLLGVGWRRHGRI